MGAIGELSEYDEAALDITNDIECLRHVGNLIHRSRYFVIATLFARTTWSKFSHISSRSCRTRTQGQ